MTCSSTTLLRPIQARYGTQKGDRWAAILKNQLHMCFIGISTSIRQSTPRSSPRSESGTHQSQKLFWPSTKTPAKSKETCFPRSEILCWRNPTPEKIKILAGGSCERKQK